MNSIVTSSIIFASVFAAALVGMAVQRVVPEDREAAADGAENDRQAAAKAQIVTMVIDLRQTQCLMFLKTEQNAVPVPLLLILVSWLAAIFVSFGLFAPPNTTVLVALALGAMAVSSAIFLILEMYTPFRGVLRISATPILDALSQMGS